MIEITPKYGKRYSALEAVLNDGLYKFTSGLLGRSLLQSFTPDSKPTFSRLNASSTLDCLHDHGTIDRTYHASLFLVRFFLSSLFVSCGGLKGVFIATQLNSTQLNSTA